MEYENEREEYYLKHKDIIVLKFKLKMDGFIVTDVIEIFDNKRLPFENNIYEIIRNMDRWIEMRGIPKTREDYNIITYKNKVSSNRGLTVGEYALNLTDHYWIHNINENPIWNDMNLFDNDYKQENELEPIILEGKRGNPNVSVDGNQIKAWKKYDNINYLWKKGRGERKQEPFNEEIASNIMKLYNIYHVDYFVKRISNNIPISVCKCMIDKNTEFLDAQYAMYAIDKKGLNKYDKYIEICKEKGIIDVKKRIDEMIAIDYLIGNEDRHPWNFGIMRNPDNLDWLKIAPIFDNGNSLFYDTDDKDFINERKDSFCRWLNCENSIAINNIDYPEWFNNKYNNDVLDIVNEGLSKNEKLKKYKIDLIIKIIKERLNNFEKCINTKINKSVSFNIT